MRNAHPESVLAHELLDGLAGIEIGGSSGNQWGLTTLNIDLTDSMETEFKRSEVGHYGEALPVDMVAPGDELPFEDNRWDFVISSHVLEHFPDPIKTIVEWKRVVRPGGYLYMIVPHKERTFDAEKPRTTLAELIDRHEHGCVEKHPEHHYSIWITEDVVELVTHLGLSVVAVQDVDDKVGNGFTVACRVEK